MGAAAGNLNCNFNCNPSIEFNELKRMVFAVLPIRPHS